MRSKLIIFTMINCCRVSRGLTYFVFEFGFFIKSNYKYDNTVSGLIDSLLQAT